ncbi:ribulose-phosphate 3-epimerase [Gorillibacterium sp. CAU 1737]|uniref:ribulose-phosphate 3-epimerase n=1 Tax=Gorillibacterium sp. CAU 1737 TaxID=3140362 RepID=UPI003260B5E1
MRIAPSILSADFSRLGDEIREAEQSGADWIHIDIMDGHFVPNLTFGPGIVKAIRPLTKLPFDVHLMIENADAYIPEFAKAGADYITVHAEACTHLNRTLQLIRDHGVKPGVVLNPATPIEWIQHVLADVELVLLMTVNPGFGGQSFLPSVVPKIKQLRERLDAQGLSHVHIEVDGGITAETARIVSEAGADVLVAGNAVFGQADRTEAMRLIREGGARRA